jgi:hypothetical protein
MVHLHLPIIDVVIVIPAPPDYKRLRGSTVTMAGMTRKENSGTMEMWEIALIWGPVEKM